jgi:hypothetical protein
MGFETPEPFTDEQKKQTKSRMESDARLMNVKDDGSLETSKEMVEEARLEMENEKGHYLEKTNVNGIDISVGWDRGYSEYTIYFPQIIADEQASKKGVSDQVLRINKDQKNAKKVFDFASQEALNEKDVYKLYLKAEGFIRDMPEEE